MEFLVCLFEFWIGHMGVYLSCRDRSMPEEFLDNTNISTIGEKRCRKWMTKCMGMEILEYTRFEAICLDHIGNKESGQSHSSVIKINTFYIFLGIIMAYKKWREIIISCLDITFYCIFCLRSEIDDSDFSSFSSYCKFHSLEIHITSIESSKLRDTKTSRIYTLTYSKVSNPNLFLLWDNFEESYNLFIW